MSLIPKTVYDPNLPINQEEAQHAVNTGTYEDDPALRLVVMDTIRAENFSATKAWLLFHPQASILYQSPFTPRYWEGSTTPRADVPFFTVAIAVNSLVPKVMQGLFYESPPFMIQKRPKTKDEAARAIGALIGYQLEDINFRTQVELGVRNAILFGTGIWKWGWETYTKKRTIYERKTPSLKIPNPLGALGGDKSFDLHNDEDIEEVTYEEYIDRPYFENITNLREVLIDPGLNVPDIQKAKYVVHRLYLTYKDLDKLRQTPGYNIPSEQEVLSWFLPPVEEAQPAINETAARNPLYDSRSDPRYVDSTADILNHPLEVLERWDNDNVTVVVQKKLVICNQPNPYGKIPFLSVGWWDTPEAFWSLGLAKTIGAEQRLQKGITDTWLDNAAINLAGTYVRTLGKGQQSQSIRISPGKIVNIEEGGKFDPLKRLDPVPEAAQHIAMSQARVELTSGANEVTAQGIAGNAAHSNMARSAAGSNMIGAGADSRPQDFVEKFVSQVFIPFLYHVHEMDRALLPKETIKYILDEELEHEYFAQGGDIIELLNAGVKFSVLAGSKMQARKQMASTLPIIVQLLTNDQTLQHLALQNKKVDFNAIFTSMLEVSGWKTKSDWILDMTPEEKQKAQMNTPAAQMQMKIQAGQQQDQVKQGHKLELIQSENEARAGREVLRHALEVSETPETLSGMPNTQGFGSQ